MSLERNKEMIDYIGTVPESCVRRFEVGEDSVCEKSEKGKRRFVVIREEDLQDLNTECMIQMTADDGDDGDDGDDNNK
jgi:hypothetical protein